MKKYSIVIPTYNHCEDLLKPCIESIAKYTNLEDVEVLIVANGCTDNTREYVESLGRPFELLWVTEPIGYTKATNIGIKASLGEYVILMNNDIILLEQPVDHWLRLLTIPFEQDPKTGITGPVKFDWDCGGVRREAMGFWLVMMRRSLFDEIGILDEIFSPGMGEDGDFSIKAVLAGYKLVSVPEDVTGMFEVGIANKGFPIWHKGNGTFADNNDGKDEVIERNNKILVERYGKQMKKQITTSIIIPTYNHFHDAFKPCIDAVLQYTDLSDKEVIVVANGCTDETWDYLQQLKDRVSFVWFDDPQGVVRAYNAGIEAVSGKYIVTLDNDSILLPQAVDQWINILMKPFLENPKVGGSSPFAHEYGDMGFILHSGCTMYRADILRQIGGFDEIYNPGYFSDPDVAMKIWQAGYECVEVPTRNDNKAYVNNVFTINFPVMHLGTVQTMDKNKDSEIVRRNREILYSRYGKKKNIKYSIVIPTYNHCDDLLKPCINSIVEFTNMDNVEVIVVANGCTDNTREYVESLGNKFKLIWSDEALGYTKATNLGMKAAQGEYVIPMNNDVQLLGQAKGQWLALLEAPFISRPNTGITGTLELYDPDADSKFLVFFCVMIKREVINKIGFLDEIFSPGYGEDIDYCLRAKQAGYESLLVGETIVVDGQHVTNFPIWHINNQTFGNEPTYEQTVIRNKKILFDRWNSKAKGQSVKKKYSIVIPTYNHCDDLLKPCIESIKQYTDLDQTEVIIVANGCTDNTREYIESLDDNFLYLWFDEGLGYTKATNEGIRIASGDYIILLNNDTVLLQQNKQDWINLLEQPFKEDPTMGLTGPLELFDDYSNHPCIIFFCVMIKREVFEKIGLLDEIFSPGGGEDIDFTVRANRAGFKSKCLAPTQYNGYTNVSTFPIWHVNNQTFGEIEEYGNWIVKRNGHINAKKHNKNIKLNLGSGGISYPGYLSVDLYDKRAHIKMDITKLDFDDNSVEEILASHVFEHLNPYHAIDILREWNRVLKPGGKLIMEMPDIEQLCKSFTETTDIGVRYGILNAIYGSVNTTGEGGPDNITAPHLFGWWPQSLWDHLTNAGFVDIVFMEEQIPHPADNLRVEARKPGVLVTEPERKVTIDKENLRAQEPITFNELFEVNSYNVLPGEMNGKTVIDVGANLGMFSFLALENQAKRVIAVEAQPFVYYGLANNVTDFPQIKAMNRAVYDSDNQTVYIPNNHVGSKISETGDPVQTIRLSTLVEQENVEDNSILKLDCEGSEFNILFDCDKNLLRKFEIIYLEMHGDCNDDVRYQDVNVLRKYLTKNGFEQRHSLQQFGYPANQPAVPMNIFVEKWVRV